MPPQASCARAVHAPAQVRLQAHREQRRLVAPVLEQPARGAVREPVQIGGVVRAQAAEGGEVVRAGEHVDRVDLDDAEAVGQRAQPARARRVGAGVAARGPERRSRRGAPRPRRAARGGVGGRRRASSAPILAASPVLTRGRPARLWTPLNRVVISVSTGRHPTTSAMERDHRLWMISVRRTAGPDTRSQHHFQCGAMECRLVRLNRAKSDSKAGPLGRPSSFRRGLAQALRRRACARRGSAPPGPGWSSAARAR